MHLMKMGNCPSYLKDMVSLSASVRTRSGLRSADTDAFTYIISFHELVPSWVNVRFLVRDPPLGTNCPNQLEQITIQSLSNAT